MKDTGGVPSPRRPYEQPGRVDSYDVDMEIMHPNRSHMIALALNTLPFDRASQVLAVDLGVGTGAFSEQFLEEFPEGRVLIVDEADAMMAVALRRLGRFHSRVESVITDIREYEKAVAPKGPFNVVFSSFTLHHLSHSEKKALLRQVVDSLSSGGWFLNADLVLAGAPAVEERIQELRVDGILRRNQGRDAAFSDRDTARRTLDHIEARDGDQPLTLSQDIRLLRSAGLPAAEILWKEYREVVYGGPR